MFAGFVILGVAVVLGGALALILLRDENVGLVEALGWGIPLGLGLISLSLLLLDFAGVPFTRMALLNAWTVAGAALIVIAWRARVRWRTEALRPHRLLTGALAALCLLQLLYAFVMSMLWPIWEYDEFNNWAQKAKAFVLHARIDVGGFYGHNVYPLLDPLLQTARHVIAGGYDERAARALFPLFLLGITLILISTFKRWGLPPWARWGLPALFLTYNPYLIWGSTTVYADVPLACYVCGAGASLINWLRAPSKMRWMVMGGLFLSAAVFTKPEGAMYAVLFAVVAGIFLARNTSRPSRKMALFGVLIGPSFLMFGLWAYWMWLHGVPATDPNLGGPHFERLGVLLKDFAFCLVNLRQFGFLWIFLALLLALRPPLRWARETIAAALLAAGGVACCYWALLCTSLNIEDQLSGSRGRLLMQGAPLLLLLAGEIIRSFPATGGADQRKESARSPAKFAVWGLLAAISCQVLWIAYVEVQVSRRTYAICASNGVSSESFLRTDPDWPLISACKFTEPGGGQVGVALDWDMDWYMGNKLRYHLFPRPFITLQGTTLGSLLQDARDRGINCVVVVRRILAASKEETLATDGWSIAGSTKSAVVLRAVAAPVPGLTRNVILQQQRTVTRTAARPGQ